MPLPLIFQQEIEPPYKLCFEPAGPDIKPGEICVSWVPNRLNYTVIAPPDECVMFYSPGLTELSRPQQFFGEQNALAYVLTKGKFFFVVKSTLEVSSFDITTEQFQHVYAAVIFDDRGKSTLNEEQLKKITLITGHVLESKIVTDHIEIDNLFRYLDPQKLLPYLLKYLSKKKLIQEDEDVDYTIQLGNPDRGRVKLGEIYITLGTDRKSISYEYFVLHNKSSIGEIAIDNFAQYLNLELLLAYVLSHTSRRGHTKGQYFSIEALEANQGNTGSDVSQPLSAMSGYYVTENITKLPGKLPKELLLRQEFWCIENSEAADRRDLLHLAVLPAAFDFDQLLRDGISYILTDLALFFVNYKEKILFQRELSTDQLDILKRAINKLGIPLGRHKRLTSRELQMIGEFTHCFHPVTDQYCAVAGDESKPIGAHHVESWILALTRDPVMQRVLHLLLPQWGVSLTQGKFTPVTGNLCPNTSERFIAPTAMKGGTFLSNKGGLLTLVDIVSGYGQGGSRVISGQKPDIISMTFFQLSKTDASTVEVRIINELVVTSPSKFAAYLAVYQGKKLGNFKHAGQPHRLLEMLEKSGIPFRARDKHESYDGFRRSNCCLEHQEVERQCVDFLNSLPDDVDVPTLYQEGRSLGLIKALLAETQQYLANLQSAHFVSDNTKADQREHAASRKFQQEFTKAGSGSARLNVIVSYLREPREPGRLPALTNFFSSTEPDKLPLADNSRQLAYLRYLCGNSNIAATLTGESPIEQSHWELVRKELLDEIGRIASSPVYYLQELTEFNPVYQLRQQLSTF